MHILQILGIVPTSITHNFLLMLHSSLIYLLCSQILSLLFALRLYVVTPYNHINELWTDLSES